MRVEGAGRRGYKQQTPLHQQQKIPRIDKAFARRSVGTVRAAGSTGLKLPDRRTLQFTGWTAPERIFQQFAGFSPRLG